MIVKRYFTEEIIAIFIPPHNEKWMLIGIYSEFLQTLCYKPF
jgi:hypothetical protein